jgi:hypothetical protein
MINTKTSDFYGPADSTRRVFLWLLPRMGTRPCVGADRPAHDSPQIPDSSAAFLESWRGASCSTHSIYTRSYGSVWNEGRVGNGFADTMQTRRSQRKF